MNHEEIEPIEDITGVRSYRKSVGIGLKELNNIEPLNVIEKILDTTKVKFLKNDHINSLEYLFNIRINLIYPDRPPL